MKCSNCNKGILARKTIEEIVEIEGGPTLKVKGIKVLQCPKCGDVLKDMVVSAEQTKRILSGLVKYYAPQPEKLPGKVAQWMRKAIGLTVNELAVFAGGLDPSTFSRAAQRNSCLDHFAAIALLALTIDFVTGSKIGRAKLREMRELDQLLDPKVANSVQVA